MTDVSPITDNLLAALKLGVSKSTGLARVEKTTLLALLARLDKAEAALRPFAKVADEFPDAGDDEFVVTSYDDDGGDHGLVTMGEFRTARALLPPPPSSES